MPCPGDNQACQSFSKARRDELYSQREVLQHDAPYQNDQAQPFGRPRPPCPSGDICEICEYALHLMLWPPTGNDDHGCLGFVDRMLQTKYCSLCQFLARLFFDASPGFPEHEVSSRNSGRRFCLWLVGTSPVEYHRAQPRSHQTETSCSVVMVEYRDGRESEPIVPYAFERSMGFRLDIASYTALFDMFGNTASGAALWNLGREVQEKINFATLRNAVQFCRAQHPTCNLPTKLFGIGATSDLPTSLPQNTRVVDVRLMCICNPPATTEYLALSYCWAKQKSTVLTLANHDMLHEPGALECVPLAPSVFDAIKLADQLNERYIWIDRLCIIQDSDSDKSNQLAQMGLIYRNATLTIIAACSAADGTDTGFPGMPGRQKRTANNNAAIRDLRLFEHHNAVWADLPRTRWHGRAWTLQEYFLSKRLIIVMSDQVYFKCQVCVFAEDYVDHLCVDHPKLIDPSSLFPCCERMHIDRLKGLDVPEQHNIVHYHNSYEELVNGYTKRKMSSQDDALNAVQGLLDILQHENEVTFLHGLPVPHLVGQWLKWVPVGVSTRRETGSEGGTYFPSWSWAGWQGEAMYVEQSVPGGWSPPWHFDLEGIKVDLIEEAEPQDHQDLPGDIRGRSTASVHDAEQSSAEDACILEFRTKAGEFVVLDERFGTPSEMHTLGESSQCLQILHQDIRVGALITHAAREEPTKESATSPERRRRTLIALSRSKDRWPMWYPLVPDAMTVSPSEAESTWDTNHYYLPTNAEPGKIESEFPLPPFDREHYDHAGEIVNVIMIVEEDGIAYRAGIGQIHADAWDAADPVERVVMLA